MALYNRKEKIKKKCRVCGVEFQVLPSRVKRVFCSRSCSTKYGHITGSHRTPAGWNKGKKMSKEWKQKLSEAKIKKPVRYWLNKKRLDLRTVNLSNLGWSEYRKVFAERTEYKQWKRFLFEKYGRICQMCGVKNKNIETHHIKPAKEYPDLILDVDNGTVLCRKCHNKVHTKKFQKKKS